MVSKRHIPTVVAVVVLALLVFSQPASVTVAQEEVPGGTSTASSGSDGISLMAPVVVPGGPGFYSANGLAFQPYPNQAVPYTFSGRSIANPDTTSHAYEAQVSLPHGATITKFVVWVNDNNASSDLWVTLARMGQDDSLVEQIAYITTTGATPANQHLVDTTITAPNIDLQNYVYWIETFLPPNYTGRLVSFRIDYTYPTYAPLIER